jgi:hypothetical protein
LKPDAQAKESGRIPSLARQALFNTNHDTEQLYIIVGDWMPVKTLPQRIRRSSPASRVYFDRKSPQQPNLVI